MRFQTNLPATTATTAPAAIAIFEFVVLPFIIFPLSMGGYQFQVELVAPILATAQVDGVDLLDMY